MRDPGGRRKGLRARSCRVQCRARTRGERGGDRIPAYMDQPVILFFTVRQPRHFASDAPPAVLGNPTEIAVFRERHILTVSEKTLACVLTAWVGTGARSGRWRLTGAECLVMEPLA